MLRGKGSGKGREEGVKARGMGERQVGRKKGMKGEGRGTKKKRGKGEGERKGRRA